MTRRELPSAAYSLLPLQSSTMHRSVCLAFLLCLSAISVKADGNEGQWIDDVSGNAEVMGMMTGAAAPAYQKMAEPMYYPPAPTYHPAPAPAPVYYPAPAPAPTYYSAPAPAAADYSSEGQWVDDVSGNAEIMGMMADDGSSSYQHTSYSAPAPTPVYYSAPAPAPTYYPAPAPAAADYSSEGQWIDDVSGNAEVMGTMSYDTASSYDQMSYNNPAPVHYRRRRHLFWMA